jgi:PAS domain S-box-containing protein
VVRRGEVPRSVTLFTVALAGAAVTIAVLTNHRGYGAPPWTVAPLCVALVLSGMLQIDFRWGRDRESLDLHEVALVPLLAVFAGPGAVLLVAVTKFASQRLLGVARLKLAFNVAQWSAATAAAGAVYTALRSPDSRLDLLALAAGAATGAVVNHGALATVLTLAQRGSLRDVLRALAPVIVPGWVVATSMNVAFGALLAVVVVERPELSVLFVVPLALFWWAQRAYSEVVVDRARLAALQQATHELARVEDPWSRCGEALEAIRSAFAAAAVAVVLSDRDDHIAAGAGDADLLPVSAGLARAAQGPHAVRVRAGDGSRAGQVAASAGVTTGLVAPLVVDDEVIGALVSVGRDGLQGFQEGELAVFEALARELGGAFRRSELHRELVRQRTHLFEIVDRSSDGIFTVATDGRILDWNPAMSAITGFETPADGGGRAAAVLRPHLAGGGDVALERWPEVGAEGLPAEIEILTRNGDHRTLSCSFSETASEPRALVVIARDVTRQRELDRLREDFVATVSHELRTPLTSILGYSTLLIDAPRPLSPEERNDATVNIRKGARRLERLVFNLLEVAKIEQRATPRDEAVDIEEAIDHAIAELRESHPDRTIRREGSAGFVRGRGVQLSVEQILTNLLSNALKYSSGDVEVGVAASFDRISVSVTDHGPGIPAHDQARIFGKFERLDHHAVQAGTGLGLYIALGLAHSMNGTLTVDSEPGRSTTFTLTLPAEVHLVAVG